MSAFETLAAAASVAVVIGAATAWFWRRTRVLEARVESATQSLEQLQRAFAKFAPAMVVDEIAARGLTTNASKKEVTVLFADLQGFTKMSEQLDPAVLVSMLNGYFARMTEAIRQHHGHVSKFMGDGLMALFGALETNPWQGRDAAEAALAMRAELAGYNEELKSQGLPPLAFGVGIHVGTVVAGVIGSQDLLEFTVIGDAVNVAARVEGLTRAMGVDILVTGDVAKALRGRFKLRSMPASTVKGKSGAIETFALEGPVSTGEIEPPRMQANEHG